ncbi:hypothetical protein LXL04_030054 [Taraxacum kok-saghyz]
MRGNFLRKFFLGKFRRNTLKFLVVMTKKEHDVTVSIKLKERVFEHALKSKGVFDMSSDQRLRLGPRTRSVVCAFDSGRRTRTPDSVRHFASDSVMLYLMLYCVWILLFLGIAHRISKEITSQTSSNVKIKVVGPSSTLSVWIGGTVLAPSSMRTRTRHETKKQETNEQNSVIGNPDRSWSFSDWQSVFLGQNSKMFKFKLAFVSVHHATNVHEHKCGSTTLEAGHALLPPPNGIISLRSNSAFSNRSGLKTDAVSVHTFGSLPIPHALINTRVPG